MINGIVELKLELFQFIYLGLLLSKSKSYYFDNHLLEQNKILEAATRAYIKVGFPIF